MITGVILINDYRSYLSLKLNKWINNDNLLLGYFAYWFFLPPELSECAALCI